MLPHRHVQIIIAPNQQELAPHFLSFHSPNQDILWLGWEKPTFNVNFCPVQKAKNLLGQEFANVIFDARQGFHLESLAIVAGTLKAGGTLNILLNHWQFLAQQKDIDSLRWAGVENVISTPHFIQHFHQLVQQFQFAISYSLAPILTQNSQSDAPFSAQFSTPIEANEAQQKIIQQILQQQADIYFLTAKRGRGKSALLGLLSQQLKQKVYLTAANKSAVDILQKFAYQAVTFIAPDELVQNLTENPQQYEDAWLFVDEAAMLPVSTLDCFSAHFQHIVFSTTIHSYEGTGRGFSLKFKQRILQQQQRKSLEFELIEPLRWRNDDRLEPFIDALLLLNSEDDFPQSDYQPDQNVQITSLNQQQLSTQLADFYGLLSLAHYRTSPIDLRRLFDAPKQRFYLAESENKLLGGIWALEEGGLFEQDLIRAIYRGERRPKGNLGAQLLAFQYLNAKACELRSLRISRIALQPNWQRKGIGKKLIATMKREKDIDFLSVSFGYSTELSNFWQKCGFDLLYLSEHKESSSGAYNALAICPLTEEGKAFSQQCINQFKRDFVLSDHPLLSEVMLNQVIEEELTPFDLYSLQNFAFYHRTLFAARPALWRLLKKVNASDCPTLRKHFAGEKDFSLWGGYRQGLVIFRDEVKEMLQKYENFL
ncbi:tRNA(Met) cytidine acetyltransferase [Haemophilus haemoglobinophilus]|nr:tRNA(Met) cytidine acetyltransferase [Canicola haemoglobinophilus]